MKNKLIIVFVLIAVGLVVVYLNRMENTNSISNTESLASSTLGGYVTTSDKLYDLTQKEAETLFKEFSIKNVSSEEGQLKFMSAIKSLATTSEEVVIKNCIPKPRVLLTSINDTIYFRNTGTSTISIRLLKDVSYSIKSGETIKVNDVYEKSNGYYTYSCMGRGPVGAIYLSE